MKKKIAITGATSGIGAACAHRFAKEGNDLILFGRRKEILMNTKKSLEKLYSISIKTLVLDIKEKHEVFKAIDSLEDSWKTIDVLINNAGLGLGLDSFADAKWQDWDEMIDTNVKGLLYVTKAFLPEMIKQKHGHIINIGSIAGKEVYENGNVYCASKHAVDALSKAMRIDLRKNRIKVTAIHPGAVKTAFSDTRFKGDIERAKKVYEGYDPLLAQDVAEVVHYVTTSPKNVCINDLVMTPLDQANYFYWEKHDKVPHSEKNMINTLTVEI